jgi:hypothetical protein
MLPGQGTVDDTLSLASDADPAKQRAIRTEAHFYAGQKELTTSRTVAMSHFRATIDIGITRLIEHIAAEVELNVSEIRRRHLKDTTFG